MGFVPRQAVARPAESRPGCVGWKGGSERHYFAARRSTAAAAAGGAAAVVELAPDWLVCTCNASLALADRNAVRLLPLLLLAGRAVLASSPGGSVDGGPALRSARTFPPRMEGSTDTS